MPDVPQRLAGLPPEKRKLLEKLVQRPPERDGPAASVPAAPPPGFANRAAHMAAPISRSVDSQPNLSLTFGSSPRDVKEGYQRFYDGVSAQLDATMFGEFSFFLNYGYVPNPTPAFSTVELPDHFINRNSVRLVLEVIGDCPLSGRRVLDVGCGRGGTVYVISRFFDAAEITGLDLSPAAIAFCRTAHRYPHTRFEQGDAEQLPFPDGCVDVVTNIESSHSYPDVNAFYREVLRVLRAGGHFLYTDVLAAAQWKGTVALIEDLGFSVERVRDVTANVLLSCDDIAQNRVEAFHGGNDPHLMRNFLATPDSEVYVEMAARRWTYLILKLYKP